MKILVVQDADWTQKGPHQQHHLMERLSADGHNIVVIAFNQLWRNEKTGLISRRQELFNVHRFYDAAKISVINPFFIKIPLIDYISFWFSSRNEINKTIKEFKPDVVIGFTSIISCYWGATIANKYRVPFIYYWTDVIHTLIPYSFLQPIGKYIERRIIEKTRKVLAINEVLKECVINLGADQLTTDVIPGGVDFDIFNPSKYDASELRQRLGIAEDETVLFFMGWIYEFSGLKEVVDSLSKMENPAKKVKILVVGDGDYFSQLKSFVISKRMENCVILTGRRPYEEIPKLISVSDICLLPAHRNKVMNDIVPIKMYEYLAMHKPVIATKLPGVIKEFGYNSGIMYVNRPEDVIDIVMILSKEDIEKNRLMAEEFIRNYDWEIIVEEFKIMLSNISGVI